MWYPTYRNSKWALRFLILATYRSLLLQHILYVVGINKPVGILPSYTHTHTATTHNLKWSPFATFEIEKSLELCRIKCTTCVCLGGCKPCVLSHQPVIQPLRHWAIIHTEPEVASNNNKSGPWVLEVLNSQVHMQHVFSFQPSANHPASGVHIQSLYTQTQPQSNSIATTNTESCIQLQQVRSMSFGSCEFPSSHAAGVFISAISHSLSQWGIYPPIMHTDPL